MKKKLLFTSLLFVQLLVLIFGFVAFYTGGFLLNFSLIFALIVYIFLGGFLLLKIEDKNIRIKSTVFVTVLLVIINVALVILSYNNIQSVYFLTALSPIQVAIWGLFEANQNLPLFVECLIVGIASLIPVGLSVIFAKVIKIKNKKSKIALVLALFLVCFGFLVKGVISSVEFVNNSYLGDDGTFYNSYYDINGVKYNDNSDVPYYDRQGNVYYWTYNEHSDESSLYSGELTDSSGNIYDINSVYIDSDGYVFIDENSELELRDDFSDDVMTDWDTCDSDGNIYASILSVSYSSDGTPYTGVGNEYRLK
jgi:hypothetical protein